MCSSVCARMKQLPWVEDLNRREAREYNQCWWKGGWVNSLCLPSIIQPHCVPEDRDGARPGGPTKHFQACNYFILRSQALTSKTNANDSGCLVTSLMYLVRKHSFLLLHQIKVTCLHGDERWVTACESKSLCDCRCRRWSEESPCTAGCPRLGAPPCSRPEHHAVCNQQWAPLTCPVQILAGPEPIQSFTPVTHGY